MLPILFSVGPFVLYTFSIFLFLAFFLGLFLIWKRGKEVHFEEDELFDAVFAVMVWGFLGSRIAYVAINIDTFGFNPVDWINIFGRPGFSLFGALFLGGIRGWRYAKKQKWDPYELGDIVVPGLALAQTILALGSFVSGSGYGIPTDSFIGIQFAGLYDKRHPVQLYEMVFYALLARYLWRVEGTYRTLQWYKRGKSEALSGFIFANYLIFSGLIGFLATLLKPATLEIYQYRVDFVLPLLVLITGGVILFKRSGRTLGGVWGDILDYYGLNSRKRVQRKRNHSKLGEGILDR